MPDAVPWLELSDAVPDAVPLELFELLVLLLSAVPVPEVVSLVWPPVLGCEPPVVWLKSVVPDGVLLLAVEESVPCDWFWVFEDESVEVELSCVPSVCACWSCDWVLPFASLSVVRDERIGSGRSPRPSPAVVIRMAPAQAMTATMAMAIEKTMTFFCV